MTNTQVLYSSDLYKAANYGRMLSYPEVRFQVKDPISSLTHFIGMILSILGMPVLLICMANQGRNMAEMISYGIFSLSMIALYGASTAYHTFCLSEKANKVLKKIDHMMIFILIAGTYTPVCISILPRESGLPLLIGVWSFAAAGILFKALWVTCPKWISSVIYIGMGWLCIFAGPAMFASFSTAGFAWLLTGGIIYTIGGVIYALKLPVLRNIHKDFGAHELFHIFVMLGSFCHYMVMFQ